jgi:hypothetical protein
MKISVVGRAAYITTHGIPTTTGRMSPETLDLFGRIEKLQLMQGAGGEYIIVECEKGEDLERLRGRLYSGIMGLIKRRPVKFAVRFRLCKDEKHLCVWKEPLSPEAAAIASRKAA